MKQFVVVIALSAMLACASVECRAERVEVKAVGTFQYEAKQAESKQFATAKATEEEKAKAIASAKQSAWKLYVAALGPARQQAIFKHEKALLERLDDFITDQVVIDVVKDAEARSLKVAVRFGFNDERVAQTLQSLSVATDPSAARSSDSGFTFLFVSRRASSIQQFDVRKTQVSENEAATVKADDGGVTSTSRTATGGSSLQKEDAITYTVSSAQDIDAAIGENLNASGIEYVGYDDVVANCNGLPVAKFRDEFVKADEMAPDTRKAVIGAAKSCDLRYFAFGTADSGVATVDTVSGNKRVFVSVRFQLWDISTKLPRKISSVGPKQYSGLGPDQTVASRNALNAAARDVAKTLVDQLNAKGIR